MSETESLPIPDTKGVTPPKARMMIVGGHGISCLRQSTIATKSHADKAPTIHNQFEISAKLINSENSEVT